MKLPAQWKNVEFTGPNIRRKETNAPLACVPADTNFVFWNIVLLDKAWGGYTLVTTYDYLLDPKKASLDLGGAHAVGVERETGSFALTTAASLQLKARPIAEPLRLIDQTELAETDRALIAAGGLWRLDPQWALAMKLGCDLVASLRTRATLSGLYRHEERNLLFMQLSAEEAGVVPAVGLRWWLAPHASIDLMARRTSDGGAIEPRFALQILGFGR